MQRDSVRCHRANRSLPEVALLKHKATARLSVRQSIEGARVILKHERKFRRRDCLLPVDTTEALGAGQCNLQSILHWRIKPHAPKGKRLHIFR